MANADAHDHGAEWNPCQIQCSWNDVLGIPFAKEDWDHPALQNQEAEHVDVDSSRS